MCFIAGHSLVGPLTMLGNLTLAAFSETATQPQCYEGADVVHNCVPEACTGWQGYLGRYVGEMRCPRPSGAGRDAVWRYRQALAAAITGDYGMSMSH